MLSQACTSASVPDFHILHILPPQKYIGKVNKCVITGSESTITLVTLACGLEAMHF